jgi:hypothetical protein
LAESFGEGREFRSAEEHQQNDENNNELGYAESEDSKGNGSSGHSVGNVGWRAGL